MHKNMVQEHAREGFDESPDFAPIILKGVRIRSKLHELHLEPKTCRTTTLEQLLSLPPETNALRNRPDHHHKKKNSNGSRDGGGQTASTRNRSKLRDTL
jgi:hypothetical protein